MKQCRHAVQSNLTCVIATIASLALAMPCANAADFVVTSIDDSFSNSFGTTTAGSLRNAILQANTAGTGPHTITFAPNVQGTIRLNDFLYIENNISINGPGADVLAIDGGTKNQVFFVRTGTVNLQGFTVRDGTSIGGAGGTSGTQAGAGGGGMGAGGALFVAENAHVTVDNVRFERNRAIGGKGGGFGVFTGVNSGAGGGGLHGDGGDAFSRTGATGGGGLNRSGIDGYSLGGSGGGSFQISGEQAGSKGGNGGFGGSDWVPNGEKGSGQAGGANSLSYSSPGNGENGGVFGGGGGSGAYTDSGYIPGNPNLPGYRDGGSGGNGGKGGMNSGGGGSGWRSAAGAIGFRAGSGGNGGDGGWGGGGGGSGVDAARGQNNYSTSDGGYTSDGGSGGNGGNGGFGGGGGGSGWHAAASGGAGESWDKNNGGSGGNGGNGGYGGGGGGSGQDVATGHIHGTGGKGGDGGFGGGGGGGGEKIYVPGQGGRGGTYGGNGAGYFGGGGAGLGGAVFVQEGGVLVLRDVEFSQNSAIGGAKGGGNATSGQYAGQGAFVDNTELTIDVTGTKSITYADEFAGGNSAGQAAGGLRKTGNGTLILTGVHPLGGTNSVDAGHLVVNGILGGRLDVDSLGSLGGNGQVGATTVQGTVSPGNSIGTIHINGNYTQSAGSQYEVELNSAGDSDQIVVTGDAIVNGGTVNVVADSGNYLPGQTFSILTTSGTVSGQYADTLDNLLLFEPRLLYTAQEIQVSLHFDFDFFATVPATPNQQSVLNHLITIYDDTTGDLRAALDQIFFLPTNQIQPVLQQLSGEAIGSLTSISFQNSSLLVRQVTDRLRPLGAGFSSGDQFSSAWSNRRESDASLVSFDQGSVVRAQDARIEHFGWVNGFGTGGQVGSDGNAAALDYTLAGTAVGVDRFLDDSTILGFAGGYSVLTQIGGDGTNAHVNALHGIVYGSHVWGDAYGIGSVGYGHYDYESLRTISAVGPTTVARADFDGNELSAYGEAGTSLPLGPTMLQPFAGAQYVMIHRESVTESGASPFNLTIASSTDDSLRGFLGARVVALSSLRDKIVSGQVHARWLHEFLGDARFVNARVGAQPAAPSFTAIGNSLGSDFGSVGATGSILVRSDLSLFLGYDLDFAQRLVAHTGYGGLQFAW